MIYQGAIKCKPYLKKRVLEPNILGTLADVKKFLSTALLTHTIFDLGKRSLSELDGVTAGSYICLMQSRLRAHLDTPITGTAQAGGASSITLAAGASAVDDYYNGMVVEITAGTRSGQFRVITAYNGTTKVATVGTAWTGGGTDNTSVYRVGGADGFTTNDITTHTSIYLTGIKIDTYNQTQSFNNLVKFKLLTSPIDTTNKLTIKYCEIDNITGASWDLFNITILNCIINNNGGFYFGISGEEISNTMFNTNKYTIYSLKFSNNIVYATASNCMQFANTTDIINSIFYSTNNANGIVFVSNGIINVINTIFDTIRFYVTGTVKTNINSPIYIDNVIIPSNTISNYALQPAVKTEYDILGNAVNNYTLDWTEIDFDDFENVEAEIGREYVINQKSYAKGNFQYYRMTFKDNTLIPDGFKAILSQGFLLFVQRDDIEEILIPTGAPKKIKNMQFYANDGTTAYDFLADATANDVKDEYFLIKAKDANNNVVVLAWYGNNLYRTIYSDCYDDTTYTIERVFQIWQADDYQNNSARFKTSNSYRQLADSPIVGSIRFNNQDNEIIVA